MRIRQIQDHLEDVRISLGDSAQAHMLAALLRSYGYHVQFGVHITWQIDVTDWRDRLLPAWELRELNEYQFKG